MRSIWKGSIAFGLVNVPVKVYTATEDHDIRFHQVHAKDGGRIKYDRVCTVCGQSVQFADIDKAYISPDDERVILTDEDFAKLPAAEKHEIPVLQFEPSEQIDPILFDKSYYLEPDSTTPKAYVLLARTWDGMEQDRAGALHAATEDAPGGATGARRGAGAADAAVARRGPRRRFRIARRRHRTAAAGDQDGRNPRRHDVR